MEQESKEEKKEYSEKMTKMHKEINNINKKLRQVFSTINCEVSNLKINVRLMVQKVIEILHNETGVKLVASFREILDRFTKDVPAGIIPSQRNNPERSTEKSLEIARLLCIISKKYFEIVSFKIRGRNIHFSGEKEEQLPSCRQNINQNLDLCSNREGPDMISFFKKKCLKSKILAEEIELLKKNEEREKATEIVKSRYSPKPDHPSVDDLVENTKQNYDSIDIFTDEEINLDKLGTMFLKIHKNSELKYSVLFDEFGEGNCIVIEFSK